MSRGVGTPRTPWDAETQAFVAALVSSPVSSLHTLPNDRARSIFAGLQSGPVAMPAVAIEDIHVPHGSTNGIDIRLVRAPSVGRDVPAIVYCHGGGWMLGSKSTHQRFAAELAAGVGGAVIVVDYTLTPEASYPVQNEQAYAVLQYVRGNASAFGIDQDRIAVAGDGAGGNMAAALTLMAKIRRGPEIRFQALIHPVLADVSQIGSYETFSDGPWPSRATMQHFLDAYLPDARARRDITAFPLLASVEQLNDLPEALIITVEHDVVRDEGEAYARKLIDAGVTVTTTRYSGTIHDFLMFNGLAETAASRAATEQVIAALRASLTG